MARVIYRDTDKVIEEDDAGNVVTTWTNPHAPGAILAAIIATAETAHEDGTEWVQPLGGHDAYKLGAIATRGGRTYRSKIPWNVTEPGSDLRWWEDITEEPEPGPVPWEPKQWPAGSVVTHDGHVWEALLDVLDPNWAPGPALWAYWKDLGPV